MPRRAFQNIASNKHKTQINSIMHLLGNLVSFIKELATAYRHAHQLTITQKFLSRTSKGLVERKKMSNV